MKVPAVCAIALILSVPQASGAGQGIRPQRAARPVPHGDPGSLPLLGDESIHLYTQEAYEGFSPVILSAVAGRYSELVGAGMDTARHLFDWVELEPSPGVYDVQAVIDAMDARTASGIEHQFCNLVVIDSLDLNAPAYIENLLASGVAWDDPVITTAFTDLLDALVPPMLERDMFLLGLSNEPGGYYETDPVQAASFQGFVREAIRHAHSIEPDLACTVVFAGTADGSIPDLMPLVDVASFNQYLYFAETEPTCLIETFPLPLYRAASPADVGLLLDELITLAQGKLICIQEIGQSTGWGDVPVSMGPFAGLENQRVCYAALELALFERRQHFRTVCNWTLNDHTPAGIQYLADVLLAEGFPDCYADNLTEIFGPTGLVHSDATASKKPAFDEFKGAVSFFAQCP